MSCIDSQKFISTTLHRTELSRSDLEFLTTMLSYAQRHVPRITCRSMGSYAYIWFYLHVQRILRRAVHSRAGHYVCTFGHSTKQDTSISSGRRELGCIVGYG